MFKSSQGTISLKVCTRGHNQEMNTSITRRRTKKTAVPTGGAAEEVVGGEPVPTSPDSVQESESTTPATTPAKKARAKKTPPVVAVVSPTGISGSFLSEQRPLIAHIPVTSTQIAFENSSELVYDPNTFAPKPYDENPIDSLSYLDGVQPTDNNDFMSSPATQKNFPAPVSESEVITIPKCKLPNNYSEKLMVLFQDSNRIQSLPKKTDIACFWCCHSFSLQPVAIPSHILDEVWYMYGNFCSPECATAYLFKEKVDSHVQWERYALLNSLYADDADVPLGAPHGIRPAPPREVLRMFGGSMDISEYRAIVHEKRLRVDVLTPPMVSIIQTMDTKPIDFYDQNLKNVFIRNDIQHKYNAPGAQGLRLRRTKPIKARESTVEWAMKIQTADSGEVGQI